MPIIMIFWQPLPVLISAAASLTNEESTLLGQIRIAVHAASKLFYNQIREKCKNSLTTVRQRVIIFIVASERATEGKSDMAV